MQQRLTGWLAQRQARISPLIAREVQVQLVRMHLADNDLATVRHWFEHHVGHAENLTRSQRQCEHVLWARLLLAQGETSEAIERLEHACAETSQTGHLHFRREIQAVLAVAHARQGAHKKAQELLMELLKTTRSQGYLRLFLDEGEELVNLLRDLFPLLREKALPAYVQRILNTFARESGMLASETAAHSMLPQTPLSPQEQKVLRLLAAGHSNAEIANALVVSVNTVRTQLQSIYRKLNVNNRVQASVIANQLDLK